MYLKFYNLLYLNSWKECSNFVKKTFYKDMPDMQTQNDGLTHLEDFVKEIS